MRTLWYDVQLRFRTKVILFWMFLFPIILCTLFSLVLRDVYALEEQTVIPLGIEMNEAYEQDATLQAVLQQMYQRDKQDIERKVSPLRCAEDAVILDTTHLDLDQAEASMLVMIEELLK